MFVYVCRPLDNRKRKSFQRNEEGLGTIAERQTQMRCDDIKPTLFLCESTLRSFLKNKKEQCFVTKPVVVNSVLNIL